MKSFTFGLVIGIALTIAAGWYFNGLTIRIEDHAGIGSKTVAAGSSDNPQNTPGSLNLSLENIKDEMAHGGQVMRQKVTDLAHAVVDATADTRITGAIKAKLVADPDLSALSVSVNTTSGVVTLSGTTSSPANIRKAIQIAWDTDGVNQVVSTIQVKE